MKYADGWSFLSVQGRLAACLVLGAFAATAQPYGIESRVANTSLLINQVPATTPGDLELRPAFPELTFAEPLALAEMPDASGRFVVMQRNGLFHIFPKEAPAAESQTTFLDLTDRAYDQQGELGCLGMAIDPQYAENGRVYVYYTTYAHSDEFPFYDVDSIIARYTNDNPADNDIDPATEEILLSLQQPFDNHNGGSLAFGPDGYLYIAFGDGGGSALDMRAQDLGGLFGKILRLDVTTPPVDPETRPYVIPPDNPFADAPQEAGIRPEIFAYGFRNPFRMAFDPLSGLLYAGDVGESTWEEVDVVRAGQNYGWPILEGRDCFDLYQPPAPICDRTGKTSPIIQHRNGVDNEMTAIIGGHVYLANIIPELYGVYLYADFLQDTIWGLRYDGTEVTQARVVHSGFGGGMRSLAQDASGEVYFLDYQNIRVLRVAEGEPVTTFPTKLSDVPALLAAGLGEDQTAQGILPYRPSSELWSDNARKSRFLALPGLSTVGYRADGGWDFPEGAVLIKNFSLPLDFRNPDATAQRVETRLLIKNAGSWHGFTYEWNEDGTDAVLLPGSKQRAFDLIDADGVPFAYSWYYPRRGECLVCHNGAANHILGVNTPQMNHAFTYPASGITDNQLRTFEHIGLFDAPLPAPPAALPRSPDAFLDMEATTAERAQSYLHANCAICHRPGGPTPVTMDFRWGVPLLDRQIVNVPVSGNPVGIEDALRFAPGDPDRSLIPARMDRRGAHQMPPLATSIVHEEAVALVRQWILEEGTVTEGEGEGETEGEVILENPHSVDQDANGIVSLSELLRLIQFYNSGTYHCQAGTEDGYAPNSGSQDCPPHASDYGVQNWIISLSELLRAIQFYNAAGYTPCESGEDGYCPRF